MNIYRAIHTVTERVDGVQKVTPAGSFFIPQEVNENHFLKCRAIVPASEAEASLFRVKNPHLFTVDSPVEVEVEDSTVEPKRKGR